MTYWLWKDKPEPDFCSHAIGKFGDGYDRETMRQIAAAEPLIRPWPGLAVEDCTFQYDNKKRRPADYIIVNEASKFVASDKLRGVLESQNVEAEYFPVEINDPDVAVDQAYWFVHILMEVQARDVLDHASSEYTEDSIGLGDAKRMVLLESKLPDKPLFRLRGGPVGTLAHDRLKQAVEAERITGVYFLHPDEWQEGPAYYEEFVEVAIKAAGPK